MFSNDHEQQQSSNLLHCMPIGLSNVLIRRDDVSEIIANMTKTLHMNTPEQTMNGVDIDDFDDNSDENRLSNRPQLIEQLQTQLINNQMHRKQTRDYLRILNESNTPAYWYKASPKNQSVYYYDPSYRKCVQQRSNSPQRIKPNIRSTPLPPLQVQERSLNNSSFLQDSSRPFTARTKYLIDLYNTTVNYHPQKKHLNKNHPSTSRNASQQHFSIPSQLHSIPTLPPINTTKQRNEQYNISNTNEKNYQPFLTVLRKKI